MALFSRLNGMKNQVKKSHIFLGLIDLIPFGVFCYLRKMYMVEIIDLRLERFDCESRESWIEYEGIDKPWPTFWLNMRLKEV